ncbi:MAG: hypothetical protein AB1513_08960 [Pseudomonadota bacterium]
MGRYLLNIIIWLDIGINVLLFSGSPYETLSSRIGRRAEKGERWACVLCKLLGKIFRDPRHCWTARVDDYGTTAPNWWKAVNPLVLVLAGCTAWLVCRTW